MARPNARTPAAAVRCVHLAAVPAGVALGRLALAVARGRGCLAFRRGAFCHRTATPGNGTVPIRARDARYVGRAPYAGAQMARASSVHVCSACGHESPRWAGRCPGCGEWNTLVEELRAQPAGGAGGPGARAGRGGVGSGGRAKPLTPVALADVDAVEQ